MRRWAAAWLLAGAGFALAAAGPAPAGEVRGLIEVPAPKPAKRGADLYGKYAPPTPPAPTPKEDEAVPTVPAAVWLDPVTGTPPRIPRDPVTMDQSGVRFVPRIVSVQSGDQVEFLNSDPVFHNVFSLSPAKSFDLGRYRKGSSRLVTFERPGVVKVFCDIHSQMAGFVVVTDTPFFTLSDDAGRYEVAGVPAGRYHVHVWAEGMKAPSMMGVVDVPAQGVVEFTASLVPGS